MIGGRDSGDLKSTLGSQYSERFGLPTASARSLRAQVRKQALPEHHQGAVHERGVLS